MKRYVAANSTPCAKHRKTVIDPKWVEEFAWLVSVDNGAGMKCSLCIRKALVWPEYYSDDHFQFVVYGTLTT